MKLLSHLMKLLHLMTLPSQQFCLCGTLFNVHYTLMKHALRLTLCPGQRSLTGRVDARGRQPLSGRVDIQGGGLEGPRGRPPMVFGHPVISLELRSTVLRS